MEKTRILVADDSSMIQELFCDLFSTKGYKVFQAYDGAEAISLFDSENPDVVMLDVMMPQCSGLEVLKHIKERSPDTPVVMMTAHGSEKTAVEAMKIGADEYLTKPLAYKNIVKSVEDLIEKNRIRIENVRLRGKIRETERYLAHLIDNVNEAIISTDDSGNIISFNRAAEKLWNISNEKMINERFARIFKDSHDDGYVEKILEITKEEGRYSGEFAFIREDGSSFAGYLSTSTTDDEKGTIKGIVAVIRDLTQEKLLREQLIESAKLASLGKIVEGIAHEVRNPLISMGGVARRMEKELGGDETHRKYLKIIIDDVNRLEDMVKDIEDYVDFARQHRAEFKPVNIREIISNSLSCLDFDRDNISIVLDELELPLIYGDHRHLDELFFHLFENAIEAMPNGGRIDIRFSIDDNYINIVIEDTGCGIPKEQIGDIYDPFYTSKMSGIGIGLAKVYMIAEEHRGFINVESEEGKGTTFFLKIPMERRQEARA